MKTAITIRLDPETGAQLDRVAKQTHRTRSDLVREAIRRQLALLRFEEIRGRIAPSAEVSGYLADEDVYRSVS